ncbi:hypothetical protein N9N28_04255 [Rubripirellula amarantea]|uniref:LITAF domain-containing protein n=1 Tax=Rubripirellula amarantea TaxID=2527999 RepID=A0A5C5WIN2_9BACT|nr:hypothetical protein [Rubripirellula amarantea]MDA8743828.1 hypothetical protein [Rubripirellula amarantea]TWT49682.1 hypothetical protein Pla22_48800 [Rubripirellula amarantea]
MSDPSNIPPNFRDSANPYQAPMNEGVLPPGVSPTGANFAPCPQCQQQVANAVSFSWWGGVLGPKLLTHVKCGFCGHKYNGKTGGSNTLGISIYLGVGVIFGIIVAVMFFM